MKVLLYEVKVVIHPTPGIFSWLDEVKMCNVPSGAPGTKMPSKKFTAMNINSTVDTPKVSINPPKVSNGRYCQSELCSFFFFKLYIIVLVLPNIKMNPPQVYMCSPS